MALQYLKSRLLKIVQLCLFIACCGLFACETAPPVQEMSDARQAIAVAKEAGAADHAASQLQAAEDFLASAEKKLSERAFHQARSDANQAKSKALDALHASESNRD